MTVILSEVAVSKTDISCLINTKFMMLLGANRFICRQGQDTFLKDAQTSFGASQPPLHWVLRFLPAKSGWGVKLTTHPHLVPRLRMTMCYNSSPPTWLHGRDRNKSPCVCARACALTNIPASSMDSVQIFVAPPQMYASFWKSIK
jgi:hypothetical protein